MAAALLLGLSVCVVPLPALAQPNFARPFGPDWAMLSGWHVFTGKGCVNCHAVRGFGGSTGPDLAKIDTGTTFFEIGAAMWNHLPRMSAAMRQARIDPPALTSREVSDVIAFLFTAQYYDELGDPALGKRLYKSKGCATCHELGGKGGHVGPGLDFLKRVNFPVLLAAAMWNHGPEMTTAMESRGVPRPTFEGRELVDLMAYIMAAARPGGTDVPPITPGTPERGERLFDEKRCVACHSVGGKGGRVGPQLGGPGHHLSLTRFAALMWNHGPSMWPRMKQRGIDVPRLSGQEIADILAYLYTSRYLGEAGSAPRGRELLRTEGCLTCHALHGAGGTVAVDFARSDVVGTPAQVIAAMWNHGDVMQTHVENRRITWPVLTGQELADITAYLGAVSKRTPRPRTR